MMLRCMRTTVNLDPAIIERAKVIAAKSGRSFSEVIEDAVRESIARREGSVNLERVSLPVHRGGEVRPGVNLDSNAELLEIMENDRP